MNTPEARRYCEWSLLVNDLKYALRRAEMFRDMAPSDAGDVGDIEISASLFRDAVVSLVACFDDTSPVYLVPASVYGEQPGGAEYFQWLKNLRHTFGLGTEAVLNGSVLYLLFLTSRPASCAVLGAWNTHI